MYLPTSSALSLAASPLQTPTSLYILVKLYKKVVKKNTSPIVIRSSVELGLASDLNLYCVLGGETVGGVRILEEHKTLMLRDRGGIYSAMWRKLGIIWKIGDVTCGLPTTFRKKDSLILMNVWERW